MAVEKRFGILRVIGSVWKVLAWVVLAAFLLSGIGVLLASIFGGGMLGQAFGQYVPQGASWASWAFGAVGGIIALFVFLLLGILYFMMCYAVGDFIYLGLAVEENTRLTAQWMQAQARPAPVAYPPAPAAYAPPPPPPPPPPKPTPPPPTYTPAS